jgi:hydrogenase maturation protease
VKSETNNGAPVLVLGIGNVLMGDEGVGVHVVRRIELEPLPTNVRCLDGGTGSFLLLESMQEAARVVLIDATVDGNPPGTLRRLTPRFSSEYPATLTAHDIGLKDLLDAAYLLGGLLDVTLFTISIAAPQDLGMDLSPKIAGRIDDITQIIRDELLSRSEQSTADRQTACHA